MKLSLLAAASVTALALGAGTASAQYPVLVPHRNHYHVVPSYSPPLTLVPHRGHFHVVPAYGGYNSGFGNRGYSGGFGHSSGYRYGGFNGGYGGFNSGYNGGFGGPRGHDHR